MNQQQQPQSLFTNQSNQQQQYQQNYNQQQQLNFQNFNQVANQSAPNFPIFSQPTHPNYDLFGAPLQQYRRFQKLMFSQGSQLCNLPQQLFQVQQNQPGLFGMTNAENEKYHINYQDDEMIEPKKEDAKQTANKYDLNEKLLFEVKALYKMGKLLDNRTQYLLNLNQSYLPGIVSIKAQDQTISENHQNKRVGVDLICLIDKSGSMDGEKIAMVRQTLSLLLGFLSDDDRYQLITFDSSAQRLTPLKRVTDGNKQYS